MGCGVRIAIAYNEKRSAAECDAEFDTRDAIAGVAALLGELGHDALPLDVNGSLPRLVGELARVAPDLVLNLAEGERGAFREAFYPAVYEHLGLRHTGSSASALAICLDKRIAKRIVAAAGVRVPRDGCEGTAPWLAKPVFEGSSKGVALVHGPAEIRAVQARYPAGVLVEEYVAGREIGVGWVAGLGLLPPIEYRYAGPVYDYGLKHVTPERVEVVVPAPLPGDVAARLRVAARTCFAALGVAGYGRADFRVTADGDIVFLEMNPLPSLTPVIGHDELYAAARAAGHGPARLLAAIVD